MNSLFKIQQNYIDLVNTIMENDGEITPEQDTALQISKDELQTKGINYGFVIRQLNSECDVIDAEIERLNKLKKQRNKLADRLKENISDAMELFGVEEIKSELLKMSFRKSESVEVLDQDLLNPKFMATKVTLSPDKAAIKEAIKSGENVIGAVLKQNKNLQIK